MHSWQSVYSAEEEEEGEQINMEKNEIRAEPVQKKMQQHQSPKEAEEEEEEMMMMMMMTKDLLRLLKGMHIVYYQKLDSHIKLFFTK